MITIIGDDSTFLLTQVVRSLPYCP